MRISGFLIAIALYALPGSLAANVIFSNYSPNYLSDLNPDAAFTGAGGTFGIEFSSTSNGYLSTISFLATQVASDEPTDVTFVLQDYDPSTGDPGAVIESWTAAIQPYPSAWDFVLPFPGNLTTLTSTLNPLLTAGTDYLFGVQPAGVEVSLFRNDTSIGGGLWDWDSSFAQNDFSDNTEMALQVTATPEPASCLLAGVGVMTLFLAQRKTRRQTA